MLDADARVVITGAAGLVGQNLATLLGEEGFRNVVAIDKHAANLATLGRLHPQVRCVVADLAEAGAWEREFDGAAVVVQLHAQIAGPRERFVRNNVTATRRVLEAPRAAGIRSWCTPARRSCTRWPTTITRRRKRSRSSWWRTAESAAAYCGRR